MEKIKLSNIENIEYPNSISPILKLKLSINGFKIEGIPIKEITDDHVKSALDTHPFAIEYGSKILRADKNIMFPLVSRNGWILEFVEGNLCFDENLFLTGVKKIVQDSKEEYSLLISKVGTTKNFKEYFVEELYDDLSILLQKKNPKFKKLLKIIT